MSRELLHQRHQFHVLPILQPHFPSADVAKVSTSWWCRCRWHVDCQRTKGRVLGNLQKGIRRPETKANQYAKQSTFGATKGVCAMPTHQWLSPTLDPIVPAAGPGPPLNTHCLTICAGWLGVDFSSTHYRMPKAKSKDSLQFRTFFRHKQGPRPPESALAKPTTLSLIHWLLAADANAISF